MHILYKHTHICDKIMAIKSDTFPFVTTWIEPEGTTLSETRQKKTNPLSFDLEVESEKQNRNSHHGSVVNESD